METETLKQVNGPVNVVRLEGKVNNIKKVIYLFMDIHYELTNQTECRDLFAKDIQLYLAESFANLSESKNYYDFFFEIYPTHIQEINYGPTPINYREKYIWQVAKFFKKLFVYEPSQNKVLMSKIFKNVRLHYADIRNYFTNFFYFQLLDANNLVEQMWRNFSINLNSLSIIINILNDFKKQCQLILEIIKKGGAKTHSKKYSLIKYLDTQKGPEQMTREQEQAMYLEQMNYLVYKIFSVYKNENIKNKLHKQMGIIEKYLSELISKSEKLVNMLYTIGDRFYLTQGKLTEVNSISAFNYGINNVERINMLADMMISMDFFSEEVTAYFTRFMDVYFLRRFLDKDYITNAITYTGAYHSEVYIEILIQDFNFKITHAAYSKIPNILELNDEIKKYPAGPMGQLLIPPIQSQCSDLTHFPENFL